MARLTKIEPADWDPRLQAAVKPEDRTPLEQGLMRYFAHTPDLALGVGALGGALKRHRTLPDRLAEAATGRRSPRHRTTIASLCQGVTGPSATSPLNASGSSSTMCMVAARRPKPTKNATVMPSSMIWASV